jgi:sirohydrochlorin cobaltochelatase
MICGHGSRDEGAVEEFCLLSEGLQRRFSGVPTEYGFLEFARPVIRDGLDRLRLSGVKRVKALPGMLFAAGHVKNDVPSVLRSYGEEHGLRIDFGRELSIDLKLIEASKCRIAEALGDDVFDKEKMASTLLLVVGRGSSDPDANSNVSKVTRFLWEGMGFGWAETAYSGVTFPLVEAGLEKAMGLGYERVLVFPYFLFTGILIKRIYDAVDRVASRHKNVEFLKAGYLKDHDLVLDTFEERLREIDEGRGLMNCMLCKYRSKVVGFEDEVGLEQVSHHHHVEGIGLGGEGGVHGGHSHDHSHDHHHHPYPHADHPLGPKSMVKD